METIRINGLIPIEGARKDIDYATGEPYEVDNDEHVSEWAMAVALANYKIGDEVPVDEFEEQINFAKMQQTLDKLVADGMIQESWDPEQGRIVYSVTDQGKMRVDDMLDKLPPA